MQETSREDRVTNEYDIYIPLVMNDGSSVPAAAVEAVKHELRDRFGGFTYFPHAAKGEWRIGSVTFRDDIAVLTVLAEAESETAAYFASLKQRLKRELEQKDLLIIKRDVNIL